MSFCKLELIPRSQPRTCIRIRAVGIKEEEMNKKITGFLDKGWITHSHGAWLHWRGRGEGVMGSGA